MFDKTKYKAIKAGGVPGQCLKADYKILATAIAHGASRIYVDDNHFSSIASRGEIIIDPIPRLSEFSDSPTSPKKGSAKHGGRQQSMLPDEAEDA